MTRLVLAWLCVAVIACHGMHDDNHAVEVLEEDAQSLLAIAGRATDSAEANALQVKQAPKKAKSAAKHKAKQAPRIGKKVAKRKAKKKAKKVAKKAAKKKAKKVAKKAAKKKA